MEKDKLDETLSNIKSIDKKNLEIEKNLSGLPILSRKEMLIEITNDIIKQHKILQEEGFSKESVCTSELGEVDSISIILESLILDIKKTPSKKIIYLRLFLDRFHEISEQDKNVIIQSIKDENPEELKEKILPLISVFKLET
ncbi:MAG: hypothetical protein ACXACC_01985 [Promethearchaeota archaeon]|jgi:hypothetical protein